MSVTLDRTEPPALDTQGWIYSFDQPNYCTKTCHRLARSASARARVFFFFETWKLPCTIAALVSQSIADLLPAVTSSHVCATPRSSLSSSEICLGLMIESVFSSPQVLRREPWRAIERNKTVKLDYFSYFSRSPEPSVQPQPLRGSRPLLTCFLHQQHAQYISVNHRVTLETPLSFKPHVTTQQDWQTHTSIIQ